MGFMRKMEVICNSIYSEISAIFSAVDAGAGLEHEMGASFDAMSFW